LVPGLSIPDRLSDLIYANGAEDSDLYSLELLTLASDLSLQLRRVFTDNGISLIIAQNTNSLPYNLVAAVALIMATETLAIPVIHQAFDFYWQHHSYSRKRFEMTGEDEELAALIEVVASWYSPLWRFSAPNEAFREMIVKHGFDPSKISVLSTPVIEPVAHPDIRADSFDVGDTITSPLHFQLNHKSIIEIGCFRTDEGKAKLTILFPSKLSLGKNIPQTMKLCLKLLSALNVKSVIQIIVSGAPYDMESDRGLALLTEEFMNLLQFADGEASSGRLPPCQFVFLCGTPRFSDGQRLTMDELYGGADLVVFSSSIETDCIGLSEALLAKKPCWIRRWDSPYADIFEEVTARLVIGVLSETASVVFDFLDPIAAEQISHHNQGMLKERSPVRRFQYELLNLCRPSTQEKAATFGREILDLLQERVGLGHRGNARIIRLGGTAASGKSTLADAIVEESRARGRNCVRVSLDDYVQEGLRSADGRAYGRDVINIAQLIQDIAMLKKGFASPLPRYYHGVAKRNLVLGYSDSWIIIEGVYALSKDGIGADGGSYDALTSLSDFDIWIQSERSDSLKRCLSFDSGRKLGPEWLVTRFNERIAEWHETRRDIGNARIVITVSDSWERISCDERGKE